MTWIDKTHIGDCRGLMRRMIADGVRVQCVVTSPPYWGLRDYGIAGQFGLERTWQRHIARMRSTFRLVRQLLAKDGTLWLNYGDSYSSGGRTTQAVDSMRAIGARAQANRHGPRTRTAGADPASGKHANLNGTAVRPPRIDGLGGKQLLGIPWRVAFALQSDGWYLRSDIIWHKPNPMPESVTDRPTKAHEYIFLMSRSERYFYDASAIAEAGTVDTRNARTVWTIPTQPFRGAHFATFPRTLVERCILAGTRPGDIVLDPFMGSGTVAEVAQSLGRRFIGCELNPEYAALQKSHRSQQHGMALPQPPEEQS